MTIDQLEDVKKVSDAGRCDPCQPMKSCLTCFYGDTVLDPKTTWKEKAGGPDEPMRLCYHFLSHVPGRATFYCSLWTKGVK